MSSPVPTVARVTSLSRWRTFFHPDSGVFRLPNTQGQTIEHLDIDLRFVDSDDSVDSATATGEIYLPHVSELTLRGAEHVCDSEERMEALAEVLMAIRPVQVWWLNASNDPTEQLTFSTHLVHPAIIAAGEAWARADSLRRLVMQGGFPCPNLSAPTPYATTPAATPAATPCPSPGPHKTSFGSGLSSIPALSTTKPKLHVDDAKTKERAQRKRQAEYALQPRFEFAMGTWDTEVINWRFDGRYTPACITAAVEYLLKAFDKSYPSASNKGDHDLPALLTLAPLTPGAVQSIRALLDKLELGQELQEYLADSVFVTTADEKAYGRLFEGTAGDSRLEGSQTRRLKAEMLLLRLGMPIIPLVELLGGGRLGLINAEGIDSDTESMVPGQTEGSTCDEDEAITPEMGSSVVLMVGSDGDQGKDHVLDPSEISTSLSESLVL